MRELLNLFWTFAKIGAVTFGGGIAMLPILECELSEKRNWVTEEELLEYFAIGQSTPGIIAVNVSTFVGFKRRGILGGIFATAGIVFPSLVIITIIALFIKNFSQIAWVKRALKGINVAVAALLTCAVVKFAKKSVKGVLGTAVLALSFCSAFFFKIDALWIILASAIFGIFWGFFMRWRKIKSKKNKSA